MRGLLICLLMIVAGGALAQTRKVDPGELTLTVTVENGNVTPYQQEMVLVTIHGIYRRHITREKLLQPDLAGFNWMQLGEDYWYESRVNGQTVKNFKRRMALYPDRTGALTIGPFIHHLTLTDEGDDWFDHDIRSEPIVIEVAPAPPVESWWLPVRRLEISDQWSNAPDQLAEGEGVLRVIRVTAVGVSPDMIPPMPTLYSPSAMIFPHPEQRLVELSPQGPVSVAFWRWTIRPTNGTSAILEPITFDYFDTTTRQSYQVKVTAQRVAMQEKNLPDNRSVPPPSEARIRPMMQAGAGVAALLAGLAMVFLGREFDWRGLPARVPFLDPSRRALRRAARAGDLRGVRRAATELLRQDGADPARMRLMKDLDSAIFGPEKQFFDPRRFARQFLTVRASAGRDRTSDCGQNP